MSAMLKGALFFFVLALVAGLFGYGGLSAQAEDMAKFLFQIFAVLFVIMLLIGAFVVKKVS